MLGKHLSYRKKLVVVVVVVTSKTIRSFRPLLCIRVGANKFIARFVLQGRLVNLLCQGYGTFTFFSFLDPRQICDYK